MGFPMSVPERSPLVLRDLDLLKENNNIPGDKRTLNKRIFEALANQVYDMELHGESQQRVWAYRKAAWAIEDLEQEVELMKSKRDGQSASRFT
jgi:hypothetical protein